MPMKRRQFMRTAAAATATTLAAPAIAQRARTLKFVPTADLSSLDPHWTTTQTVGSHAYYVFDTLYGVNGKLEPKPQMAEGHQIEDGGRTWLIRLREGLKFHNGEPVLARDAAQSLRRWSARDVFGQTAAGFVDEWTTADDRTIKVKLKRPFPLLADAIGKPNGMVPVIMPEHLAKTDPNKQVTEMIGSGPYRFLAREFVQGANVAYERFDGYVPRQEAPDWTTGGKVAKIARIEWKIINDPSTVAAALQNQEVDWWEQVQPDLLPLVKRMNHLHIQNTNPIGFNGTMRFNHLHAPFNDARIRRAVQVAVNQEDYMQAINGADRSSWQVCRSQFPCGTTYGNQVGLPNVQSGNIELAKRMIQEAGYKGEKAVIINPTDFHTIGPLGDITFDMLKKIGLNVELAATDWGTVVQRRSSKETPDKGGWSIFHTWFTGAFILNPIITPPYRGLGNAGWFGWYENPKVEELTQAWLDAPDEAGRLRIANEIQVENYTQVPTVTLGQFQIPTAWRKSLTGKLEATGPLFWNVKRA